MFDRDRWQEIYHVLKSNKLRTFLTAFGVFWGIFMLVIMLGAGKGLQNGVFYNMGDFATNSVFVWAENTSMPYKGFPKGRWYQFNNDDTKAIKDNIPEIQYLAPRVNVRFWEGNGKNNVTKGRKSGSYSIFGDYPEYNKIDPVTITQGRFLNHIDINEKRKVVIIGNKVVQDLFAKNEKIVGEYLKIQGIYFKVIGTFKSRHSGGWGEWQEQCVFLPFTTLQQVYNYGNDVGWYSITSKPNYSATFVLEKVKRLLKKRHDIHPDDKEAMGSENVEEEFIKLNGLFLGINTLVWIVGVGTLLAGIIGVSNIMLVIVRERTKEIGIQRAIGASPVKIISQILTESVVLTAFAGYVGLVVGVGIIEGINKLLEKGGGDKNMFTNPYVDFNVAMKALIILIFAGLLAGLIPASRAVKMKTIDALRTEI